MMREGIGMCSVPRIALEALRIDLDARTHLGLYDCILKCLNRFYCVARGLCA